MLLSSRCFAVTGFAYVPPLSVNAGFIVGEQATLLADTAANALAAATIHGYASAVRPNNRIMVLNTEPHFDHIGGNGYFRERGAEIHGHALIARTAEEFQDERDEFCSLISNPARRRRGEQDVFYHQTYRRIQIGVSTRTQPSNWGAARSRFSSRPATRIWTAAHPSNGGSGWNRSFASSGCIRVRSCRAIARSRSMTRRLG